MKSFNGLVSYQDLEELMLSNGISVFMNPLMPIDDLCIVGYYHGLQSIEYAILDATGCATTCFYRVEANSSFHLKAYSCSNIECVDCEEQFSRLSHEIMGCMRCSKCNENDDIFGYDRDTLVEMFRDAKLMKIFPRWRWK